MRGQVFKRQLACGGIAITLALAMLPHHQVALADPFDDAVAALQRSDYKTALSGFRELADQGDAKAQYNLGVMYADGQGVPQDYKQAVEWFRKAADQGDANAQYNVGFMYYNGQGVTQSYKEAAKWYRKAADQGDASAQHNLGLMYDMGQGVPKDFVTAYMWFILASVDGDEKAVNARDALAKTMTPAQIAEAQKMAREWQATTK